MSVYAAGFPCTPYRALHHGSALLDDEHAQQLWKVLDNFKESCPAATWLQQMSLQSLTNLTTFLESYKAGILENVIGFRKVRDDVLPEIQRLLPEFLV